MEKSYVKIIVLTLICSVVLLYAQNYWTQDKKTTDLPKSTPEEQGMDSELLVEALSLLAEQEDYEVHSLLIVRNGYIVTDAYFYPFAAKTMHNTFSVTKSIHIQRSLVFWIRFAYFQKMVGSFLSGMRWKRNLG